MEDLVSIKPRQWRILRMEYEIVKTERSKIKNNSPGTLITHNAFTLNFILWKSDKSLAYYRKFIFILFIGTCSWTIVWNLESLLKIYTIVQNFR